MGRMTWIAAAAVIVLSLSLCSCRSGRPYGYWDGRGFHELRPLTVEAQGGDG